MLEIERIKSDISIKLKISLNMKREDVDVTTTQQRYNKPQHI